VKVPGTTVWEVSRRHQITRSLIHNWRRQEAASLLGATVKFTLVQLPAEFAPAEASGSSAFTVRADRDRSGQ
jgi:transposase-like protein